MTDPITPPKELVQQWVTEFWHEGTPVQVAASELYIATKATQWGADQELEACCEWLSFHHGPGQAKQLRAARHPKPASLKEQALEALEQLDGYAIQQMSGYVIHDKLKVHADTIRHALEQLND